MNMLNKKKLMHAVQYDKYGGGPAGLKHVVDVPIPSPKKGQVLIMVEAVSLNPVDWKMQKGIFRPLLPLRFPFIPATDVAGEVVQLGAGVNNLKLGDKVVAMLNPLSGGGLAEYGVASEDLTVPLPPELSADDASGLPVAGLTAHMALTRTAGIKLDGTGPSKNVLVTAASGGVGSFAVQLAKMGNCHVTATCGSRNVGLVRSLGADEVLDYKTPQGSALRSPSGRKYDFVIHCAPAFPWSVFEPNLSDDGTVIDVTPGLGAVFAFAMKKVTFSKKQLVPLHLIPKGENLRFLVDLARIGEVRTVVDSKFPLSEAEEAWAKSIHGHATGKIIVEP